MASSRIPFKSMLHAWDVEFARSHYDWMLERTDDPSKIKIWAFKYPKQDQVWAYLLTCDRDWKEYRYGHIRAAIADGWIPEEIQLNDLTHYAQKR